MRRIMPHNPRCRRCGGIMQRDTWCQDTHWICYDCYPDHDWVFAHGATASEERSHTALVTSN